MPLAIFDTGVLVNLVHGEGLQALVRVTLDRVVTDVVDGELLAGRSRHPEDAASYEQAKHDGLLRVEDIVVGTAAYAEFLRLRARRVNPARNRGEDSCIALALTAPESRVYIDDHGGANRARQELGDPSRVLGNSDI